MLEVAHLTQPKVIFAERHPSVYEKSRPLAALINQSSKVRIIGGTLLSLTDHGGNLEVLARLEKDPRILLMHPDGYGISAAEKNRAVYHKLPDYNLKVECWRSVRRLAFALGRERALRCVRLYRAMPTTSIYRLDDVYVLTCYTFGRGGGSPSMLVYRGPKTEGFCRKLDEGFEALWDSADELTEKLIERQEPA